MITKAAFIWLKYSKIISVFNFYVSEFSAADTPVFSVIAEIILIYWLHKKHFLLIIKKTLLCALH